MGIAFTNIVYYIENVIINKTNNEEWTENTDLIKNMTADWFGDGSEIRYVHKENVNDTLQYYGSERYYERTKRNDEVAFIAAVVLACCVSTVLMVVAVTVICKKKY